MTETYSYFEPLLERGTTNLYRGGAFRVLGFPAVVSAEEVEERWEELSIRLKLGWEINFPDGAFPLPMAEGAGIIEDAYQRLEDPARRLCEEIFWFWPETEAEGDDAIAALEGGSAETARDIWAGREGEFNVVATHNLAVLNHMWAIELEHKNLGAVVAAGAERRDTYWLSAARRWKLLADSEDFWSLIANRIERADYPHFTADVCERVRMTLPIALTSTVVSLSLMARRHGRRAEASRLTAMAHKFAPGPWALEEATSRIAVPVKRQLERLFAEAERHGFAERHEAAQAAQGLLDDAHPLIGDIDVLLADGNPSRTVLHEKLIRTIIHCIGYFLPFARDKKDWTAVADILDRALNDAANGPARSEAILLGDYCRNASRFDLPKPPRPGQKELEGFRTKITILFLPGPTSKSKFEILRDTIVKCELHKLRQEWEQDSDVYVAASNEVARVAKKFALDLLGEGEVPLAREAIRMARELCLGDENLQTEIDDAGIRVDTGELSRRMQAACKEAKRCSDLSSDAGDRATRQLIAEARSAFAKARDNLPRGHAALYEIADQVITTGLACITAYGFKAKRWDQCLELVNELIDLAREMGPSRDVLKEINRRRLFLQQTAKIATALRPLEDLCAGAVKAATSAPNLADRQAALLIRDAPPLLASLADVIPKGQAELIGAHDKVAQAVIGCSGLFGSKTKQWRKCLKFAEAAHGFAASEAVKREIDTHHAFAKRLEEEGEISFYTARLNEIEGPTMKPAQKLFRLTDEMLPTFEELKSAKGERSSVVVAIAGMIAQALLRVAEELYANPRDYLLGDEALSLAETLGHSSGPHSGVSTQAVEVRKYKAEMEGLHKELTQIVTVPHVNDRRTFGMNIHLQQAPDSRGHTFVTTLFFFFLNLPLLPLARYRVLREADGTHQFLGKLALSAAEKVRWAAFFTLCASVLGFLCWYLWLS